MVHFKLLIAITMFLNTSFHQVFVCGDEILENLARLYCNDQLQYEYHDGRRYYMLTDEVATLYCTVILLDTFETRSLSTLRNENGLRNLETSFRYLTNKIIAKKYEVSDYEKNVYKKRMLLKKKITMGYYNDYQAHANKISDKLQFINLPRGFCEKLCLGEILDWFSTDNPDKKKTQSSAPAQSTDLRPREHTTEPHGLNRETLSKDNSSGEPKGYNPNANPSLEPALSLTTEPSSAPAQSIDPQPREHSTDLRPREHIDDKDYSTEPHGLNSETLSKDNSSGEPKGYTSEKQNLVSRPSNQTSSNISPPPAKRANRPVSLENPYGNFPKEKADCALSCQAIFKLAKFEDIRIITRYEIFKEFYHNWTYDTLNYEGVTGKRFPTKPTEEQNKIKHDIETYLLKYFKIYEDRVIDLHKNADNHLDLNLKSAVHFCETTGKTYVEDFEEDVIKGDYCIFEEH